MKVEHAIIAVLVLALLYYVYIHYSLLGDLSLVPNNNNPKLKVVKNKHYIGEDIFGIIDGVIRDYI